MRISLNWLKEYIAIDHLTAKEVAKNLTDLGLEVEGIETSVEVTPDVVVGKIHSAQKHPNADTLRVCEVDIGTEAFLKIVCGAPNARAGIFVCVAKVGAVLPGDFKIKESKIRGELSQGMLCSAQELNIGADDGGIMELSAQKTLGIPVASVLAGDSILELNVTPNRGDCLGYIGIARELSAKLGIPVKTLETENSLRVSDKKCPVAIETDHCGRIVSVVFSDVFPHPSPEWLKTKLATSGMRSINVLVDLTNFIMLECNQPVHAYDARTLQKLCVRPAVDGEILTTLDGKKLQLTVDDLVISDSQPLGLAGVMGGLNTEIKADTSELILEVAHFDARSVRKTAKRYALHSEASKRYERQVDINGISFVIERFAHLIDRAFKDLRISDPNIKLPSVGKVTDLYPKTRKKSVISLRPERIKNIVGFPKIQIEFLVKTFSLLGLTKIDENAERLVFEIPTWRTDLERECDLIEEYTRHVGLDQIPSTALTLSSRGDLVNDFFRFLLKAKEAAAACGLTETIQFPFAAQKDFENLQLPANHPFFPRVKLSNAVSETDNVLVTTLVAGLLRALTQVRRGQVKGARIFEVGRGYFDFASQPYDFKSFKNLSYLAKMPGFFPARAREDKRRFGERVFFTAMIDSPAVAKTWKTDEKPADFFAGKELCVQLGSVLGVKNMEFVAATDNALPFLHPKASALVQINGKTVGYLGELHPGCYENFDLSEPVVIVEWDLETVFDSLQKNIPLLALEFKFPAVERDLSWIVPRATTHQKIYDSIRQQKSLGLLQSLHLFDIYTGEGIAADKISVAYRFRFQSAERTLTDAEVDKEMLKILEIVKTELHGEVRS